MGAGEHGDVLQHGLAAIAETRGFDGADVQGAAQLVHHQGGESFTLDLIGDDQQVLAGLSNLLEQGQEFAQVRDLLLVDQDHG